MVDVNPEESFEELSQARGWESRGIRRDFNKAKMLFEPKLNVLGKEAEVHREEENEHAGEDCRNGIFVKFKSRMKTL